MNPRILVVEDDEHLADGLRLNLELEGYEPVMAVTAEEGMHYWKRGGVNLILLDVMLPGMDGFEFCRRIREEGDRVPVLFLTARGRDEERIRGLEMGGDDYITKPFNLQELLARIKGIFRRQEWIRETSAPKLLAVGKCQVDLNAMKVQTPTGTVDLKEKEALILRVLFEKAGEPVKRRTILDRVWGYDAYPTTRTVDNFILNLRKILEEDPGRPRHIVTVHGVGYRLEV
ncbi:MAG TPA: response regulator transcription factor [Candidatus Krumholzibacteria bacterium]|nr:response regulator transcription factor [Candidatus Krumholzibacteria bacterium]HRX51001.1 response regulator transcription factor [Candidatus Krumholzibacteria bacterium]